MLKRYTKSEWAFYTPKGDGEQRSVLVSIDGLLSLDVEIRSSDPVSLQLIAETGETLFLEWGQVLHFHGRCDGFVALEVVASKPFAYRTVVSSKWLEKPDPTPLTIAVDEAASTPVANLVRDELRKYVGRLEAANALASDVDIEELYDDIEQGDLDFEEEPDPFGLGYEERLEAFHREQSAAVQDAPGDVDRPEADGEPEPPDAAPPAKKPGSKGASEPGGQS